MKSPFTGKEMVLYKEKREIPFRNENFSVIFHYYQCEDTQEQFTSTALDELNMNQVYHKYRDKHNIPFPEEIIRIRKKYEVPITKMSQILGFGINSYSQYEAGEMPSVSNARLIQMVDDPNKFIELLSLNEDMDETVGKKILHKAESLLEKRRKLIFNIRLEDYLLGSSLADIYSGYRIPSIEKLTEMLIYFSEKVQPYKAKMNKLLFYADFLMFKKSCFSISGVRYKAINMGPVPHNFNSIFEYLANEDYFDIIYTEFENGGIGEQFIARKDRYFNPKLFTEEELQVMEKVAITFKDISTKDIIEISHLEKAWQENQENRNSISYEYAFDLSQI